MTAKFHSVWPRLNKQERLEDYTAQVRKYEFTPALAEVGETVYLTTDEWVEFTSNLLNDRPWLDGKGGCPEQGVRSVILVVRPGATRAESLGLFVDPQGHDYARYVGFYMSEDQPRMVTNPPGLLGLADIMGTTLNGVSFKDRVFAECEAEAAS